MSRYLDRAKELRASTAPPYNCAQSVIVPFADVIGMDEDTAYRMGANFGGGMKMGSVCGAVTGALMVLGSLYGQHNLADKDSRETSNEVADRMTMGFAEACGSCICKEILGYDISTPEGKQQAREKKLFEELCPQMVANAVAMLEKIINERQ